MVTIMETEEMKQVNEEILNRWRATGFLNGLKSGSINEWRCAKSFENVALYLISGKNADGFVQDLYGPVEESESLTILAFPLVRKAVCTGKKRLHRILSGEEVCDFLTTVTVGECVEHMRKRAKTAYGKILLKIIDNYLAYADITMHASDASLTDFMDGIKHGDSHTEEMFKALMDGVFDIEAELLSAATDIFVERNCK